jgi:hypothetical protein
VPPRAQLATKLPDYPSARCCYRIYSISSPGWCVVLRSHPQTGHLTLYGAQAPWVLRRTVRCPAACRTAVSRLTAVPRRRDGDSIAVWRGELKTTTAQAERTVSRMRSCFSPREQCTVEPANSIELVRCKMSCQVVSHRLPETETHQAFRRYGLQPSTSAVPLPFKRHGVRRAIYVRSKP